MWFHSTINLFKKSKIAEFQTLYSFKPLFQQENGAISLTLSQTPRFTVHMLRISLLVIISIELI